MPNIDLLTEMILIGSLGLSAVGVLLYIWKRSWLEVLRAGAARSPRGPVVIVTIAIAYVLGAQTEMLSYGLFDVAAHERLVIHEYRYLYTHYWDRLSDGNRPTNNPMEHPHFAPASCWERSPLVYLPTFVPPSSAVDRQDFRYWYPVVHSRIALEATEAGTPSASRLGAVNRLCRGAAFWAFLTGLGALPAGLPWWRRRGVWRCFAIATILFGASYTALILAEVVYHRDVFVAAQLAPN